MSKSVRPYNAVVAIVVVFVFIAVAVVEHYQL